MNDSGLGNGRTDGRSRGTRVALITGGSHGVGRAIAMELGRRGTTVVFLHSPNGGSAARDALGQLRAIGADGLTIGVDVADDEQVARAFDEVLTAYGRVDIVINGAGYLKTGSVIDLDPAEVERMFRTMVLGVFVMCRHAARALTGPGVIVNLSSVVAGLKLPGTAAYVAAKAAVEAMTPVLADELRPRGISVNSVVMGPNAAEVEALGETPVVDARWRVADAADGIARLVADLVEPHRAWVSGHVVPASSWPA